MINGNDFLKREYPAKYRTQFVPIIKQAKEIVNELYRENTLFQSSTAINEKAKVVNIAIEYEFQRRIDNGLLPFSYNIKYNSAKNHRHLEIITKNAIMTISQVNNKTGIPRGAKFRANLGFSNQMMFEFMGDEPVIKDTKAFILLSHSSNEIDVKRAIIGLPEPNIKSWIYNINLLDEMQLISINDEFEDKSMNDEDWLISFKEGVIQEVKNRGGNL